ncbi:MAG: flagellin [Limnohabitans sp.]
MAVINTNVKSLQAQDALNINNRNLSTAMQRLSTGSRINSASDDAAGLAISTRMDSQVRGLNMAIKNANDAISVTQTAEGAMDEVTNILQRMRELSVQSANDTNSAEDRKFLNLEIQQLSQEIDRIANTTQFNGINVLDGSFKDKVFQIGANRGQTMGLNIGSMNAKVLGVASGTTDGGTTTSSVTTSASTTGGAAASGTSATKTVVNMEFLANGSTTGTYGFTLKDSVTGISTAINGQTVDMTNEVSKAAFAEAVNEALQDARANTSLTGSTTTHNDVDLTDPANAGKVKFSISVDGGEAKSIDLTQRLLSTSGVSANSVTQTEILAAMNEELSLTFDANVTAATAAGAFKIADEQGRRLEISQGAGDGNLFGTDADNDGSLLARASQSNPISVNWDGDNLVVTNDLGGKIAVSNFSASSSNQVIFNIVDDAQIDSMNIADPVVLGTGSAAAMPTASYVGKTESSEIAIRFSDLTGDGTNSNYTFKLTNGDGDVYASLSNLDVFKDVSQASVVGAIKTALSTGVGTLDNTDSSMNVNEFDVTFNGDTLVIKNNAGRALAVEEFSSTSGYVTVTPMNELGASEVLSTKNAHTSETRVKVNTGAFGQDLASAAAVNFQLSIDGVKSTVELALTLGADGSANLANGVDFAAAIEDAFSAAVIAVLDGTGSATSNNQDITSLSVKYDADKGELVIRDTAGRSVGFGYGSANPFAGTGQLLMADYTTGLANKGMAINTSSSTAQGDVYEATRVEMTFNGDDNKFNFSVNGQNLTAAGSYVTWDASESFQNSSLKTNLDDLMTDLNAVHPNAVFEYAVSGRSITFYQRDGGELKIADFKTPSTHKDSTATLTPAQGQGEATTLSFNLQTVATGATASGTLGVATEATLNLEGDDVYSLTISDGTKSYSLANTTVDISDANSTNKFFRGLEKTLAGSNIDVSMDLDGNVLFKRQDGGQIVLQSFTSATGKQGTWTPSGGQGEALKLDGKGAVAGAEVTSSGGTTTVAGGTSVSQISIATQDSASKALDVIDKAISYVNLERSKLGAVQNRLTHTIDNLSNVVTNTSASRSRIKDTDYAATTAELARTQIIQQAATAMLAQANQAPQSVLSLLK